MGCCCIDEILKEKTVARLIFALVKRITGNPSFWTQEYSIFMGLL